MAAHICLDIRPALVHIYHAGKATADPNRPD